MVGGKRKRSLKKNKKDEENGIYGEEKKGLVHRVR